MEICFYVNRRKKVLDLVHPEQKEDEFFFLNLSCNEDIEKIKREWKTVRVGTVAFLEGKKTEGLVPVFVKKDEVYNKKSHYQQYFEVRNRLNTN